MKLVKRAELDGQHSSIYIVDSVGTHRGMHYYNFGLVSALDDLNPSAFTLVSTAEAVSHPLRPENLTVKGCFKGIYGKRPKWYRGIIYSLALLRLARWFRSKPPEIVHFHFFQVPWLDYLLLRWLRFLGIKIVTTVHDVVPFELGNDFTAAATRAYHRLYENSDGLVLHSDYTKEALEKLDPCLLAKPHVIMPHGGFTAVSERYEVSRQAARNALHLEAEDLIILVFGTIKANKRLDLALHALRQVVKVQPNTKLVIVGKLQDRSVDADMALAKALGIDSNVIWRIGYVSDEEMGCYFSAADVALFPYEWIYQSGAMLMAMSFGLPVVATSVGSNVDVIESGKNGLLVPLGSPEELAVAITKLLNDPPMADRMGNEGRYYVNQHLSWTEISQTLYRFYSHVISKNDTRLEQETT